MKKPSKVVFITDKMEELFYSLPDEDPIKKSIVKAIKELRENAFAGIQIAKKQIPKEFKEYKNLWKVNLVQGWRLLYTITADDEIELITAILEWGDHKSYERRMKF